MQQLSNERIKELSKLRLKKYREESGLVLVEGQRTIRQLLISEIRIKELYLTGEALEQYEDIPQRAVGSRLFLVDEKQISRISAAKSPQKIIGLVEQKRPSFRRKERLLYLDRVSEPGNLGAIFRTAQASGMDGIVLSPACCEIYNPKTVRASVGTVFTLPSMTADYDFLARSSNEIIVTDAQEGVSLFSEKLKRRSYILVIGSEASGIAKELLKVEHFKLKIPMLRDLESLNAAVAAGLCMYSLNQDIIEEFPGVG